MVNDVKHDNMQEATEAFAEGFCKAEDTKKWMAAVWGVEDEKVVMIRRTTYDFPTGDFDVCLKQLKESLEAEKKRMQLSEPEALPEADFLKFVKKGKEKGTLEKVAEASGIEKPDFLIDPEKHSEAVPDEVIDVDCLSNKTKEKLAEAELEKNVELSMEEMGFEKLAEAKEKLEKGELVNVDFLNSKDDRIPMNESLDDKVTEPMEETPKPCED